jgi:23S rRNA pseudouridine2605 synthase
LSEPTEPEPRPERLQKLIARAGLASRRVAEEMISAGRVTIDGRVARLGDRADPEAASIEVDGVPLPIRPGIVSYIINKPLGTISTTSDPHGRPTVVDLVPAEPRVFTVGRLDADTTGLLILTNDGDMADRLMHPRHGVSKTYVAMTEGRMSQKAVRRLVDGIELGDGPARAHAARILDQAGERTQLEIVMTEGRKREVRRMCKAVGHPVAALHRVAIADLRDATLRPGEYRELTIGEVRRLYEAAS